MKPPYLEREREYILSYTCHNLCFPFNSSIFLQIKGMKASWTLGSSFPIKKAVKTVPKIHTDDELDLIDEDSLLTEEDLKKPQLPPGLIQDRTYFG